MLLLFGEHAVDVYVYGSCCLLFFYMFTLRHLLSFLDLLLSRFVCVYSRCYCLVPSSPESVRPMDGWWRVVALAAKVYRHFHGFTKYPYSLIIDYEVS